MIRKRIRTFGLTTLVAALALLGMGCSTTDNPLSSSDRTNDGTAFRQGANGDVEIAGRVDTIDPDARLITLINNSTLIDVQETAEIVLKDTGEVPITLNDINPGDSLEARGIIQGDGSLSADRIRVRVADDSAGTGPEVELYGRVATIDAANRTMTLKNDATLITVAMGAEIVHKLSGEEIPIRLQDIVVDDSVEVRGTLQAENSLLADRVRLRANDEDFAAEFEFTTTITGIDYAGMTFTVASRSETITVDANTYIFVKVENDPFANVAAKRGDDDDDDDESDSRLRKPLTFQDLSVGDTVEVYANQVDPSTLYAVAIELEDGAFEGGLEVQFKDTLASVDVAAGTVTFMNETWLGELEAGADLRGLADEMLTLADFSAGELVEVKGFRGEGDTLRIVRMHKDNN